MKRVAIVNQRYGLEVNGGSEYYTRLIAEHLNQDYDLEVLTTCAVDYITWENEYKPGISEVNGVKVRRFPVDAARDTKEFNKLTEEILNPQLRNPQLEKKWVEKQGPYCPKLIDYIIENEKKYDVFIFVTYLYYLTVMGLPKVKEKAILIPTAHDEPFLNFDIYKELFQSPKGYIFLTDEERKLVHSRFQVEDIYNRQAAIGIDVPKEVKKENFIKKYKIEPPFMIYVGRIDEGKDCHWMFRYFEEYKKRNPESQIKLVLMGKAAMSIPKSKDIISLGFVSEQDKYDGIMASEFLVLPSEYESLSISVLEAMALSKPVLVNGKCDVLKGHCKKSNAGLYYENYFEFEAGVTYLQENKEVVLQMQENAQKYVDENYKWDVILSRIAEVITYVAGEN